MGSIHLPRSIVVAASLAMLVAAVSGASGTDRRADAPGAHLRRSVMAGGFRIELDLREQVLSLDLAVNSELFANRSPVTPTLDIATARSFMPASVLAYKAKVFDDGLVAAAELAAQQGQAGFPSKAAMLRRLCETLADHGPAGPAHEVAFAAARLGGLDPRVPDGARSAVQRRIAEFMEQDVRSKPVGVYTWSPALSALFQQDRMLQTNLADGSDAGAVVAALRGTAGLWDAYESALRFHAGLTNPPVGHDLRALAEGRGAEVETLAILPPARNHEIELVKRLFGGLPPPSGFDLQRTLVREVRAGRLSLAPVPSSGWYDHQAWALEPLLSPERTPESAKLVVREGYRGVLEKLFMSLLALARETQIKQAETPILLSAVEATRMPIIVDAALTVEPLATHYRRRALSYVFVRDVLERSFGPQGLATLHRLTPAGPVGSPLGAELDTLIALHHGAHVLACRELGMEPEPLAGRDPERDLSTFEAWRDHLGNDPSLSADVRMMVPLYHDAVHGRTRVWAVLGWSSHRLDCGLVRKPGMRVLDARSGLPAPGAPEVRLAGSTFQAVYPLCVELDVARLLDRDEFRALCDRERTPERILSALQ